LRLHQEHLLCQSIWGVGFFRIAIPEVFFFERNRRVLWVGADGADCHELFDTLQPGLVDELHAHHQVVVEEFAGLLAVGTDAADLGCKVDDDIGLGRVDHADDLGFAHQVILGILWHKDLTRAVFLEPADEVRAQKAGSAGDTNTFSGKVKSLIHVRLQIGLGGKAWDQAHLQVRSVQVLDRRY